MTSALVGCAITCVCVLTSVNELPPLARSVDGDIVVNNIVDADRDGASISGGKDKKDNALC